MSEVANSFASNTSLRAEAPSITTTETGEVVTSLAAPDSGALAGPAPDAGPAVAEPLSAAEGQPLVVKRRMLDGRLETSSVTRYLGLAHANADLHPRRFRHTLAGEIVDESHLIPQVQERWVPSSFSPMSYRPASPLAGAPYPSRVVVSQAEPGTPPPNNIRVVPAGHSVPVGHVVSQTYPVAASPHVGVTRWASPPTRPLYTGGYHTTVPVASPQALSHTLPPSQSLPYRPGQRIIYDSYVRRGGPQAVVVPRQPRGTPGVPPSLVPSKSLPLAGQPVSGRRVVDVSSRKNVAR